MASFSSATSSALIETADLAGAAVELGDAGIDLFADGEPVGPLVGAVAGEFGALDEGGQVGAGDLHVDPAVLHLDDLAGDDRAFLEIGGRPASSLVLAAKGSPASCLTPSEIRSFSMSMSSTLARTISPFL